MLFDTSLRSLPLRSLDMHETRRVALVVEDDPRFRAVMKAALVALGFDVLCAAHYDAAVLHLATAKLDLACIDVALPDKSGHELCEHIRGPLGLGQLPIIMACDYGSAVDRASAESAGANAFLRKPFSRKDLSLCVRSLLTLTAPSGRPVRELGFIAWALRGRPVPTVAAVAA
jgi:DNA-binding response OmpR family regulator